MNKKLLALTIIIGLSTGAFAQSIKQNIDKAAKTPSTKENAAKADVRLHNKKKISGSTIQKNPAACTSHKKKKKSSP